MLNGDTVNGALLTCGVDQRAEKEHLPLGGQTANSGSALVPESGNGRLALKSAASSAILALPPFAVQALRVHRRHQHRLRLALGQLATLWLRWVEPGQPPRPVELDLVFRTKGSPHD
jgi:hypothetical protein